MRGMLGLIVDLLIALVVLGFFAASAPAHEFYPWECCSATDCYPTGEGAAEADPAFTRQGWRLSDGHVVPHASVRPSPDGRFHLCRKGGLVNGALIVPDRSPACLWVPFGAS